MVCQKLFHEILTRLQPVSYTAVLEQGELSPGMASVTLCIMCTSGRPCSPWNRLLILQVSLLLLASVPMVLKKQARILPPLQWPACEILQVTCQLLCQVACWLRAATPGSRYASQIVRCLSEE